MKFLNREVIVKHNSVYDAKTNECLGAHYYSQEYDMHYVFGSNYKGPLEK